TITINYTPCIPPPSGGFKVRYRLVGDTDFIEIGPFTTSPIVFEAEGDPGAAYEGFLFADCGGGKIGDLIPWTVGGGGESSFVPPEFNYHLSAAFNLSIDEVIGPGVPALPPTGVNGSQEGNHTGIVGTIQVILSGSLIPFMITKIVTFVNNVEVDCQVITVVSPKFIPIPANTPAD